MKNLKNLAFGLLVAVLAVGFSAFTSNEKVDAGDMYTSQPNNADYDKLTEPFNPLLCDDSEEKHCSYTVTPAGASTVTGNNYSEAQLEAWASQAIPFVTRSTELGIYDN